MTYDDRASDIRALLWEHAHPALRGMDRDRIAKLAEQILRIATDRGLWTKWGPGREEIAERAANLWIPLDDLQEALNALPGPALTRVDVEQRIRGFRENHHGSYPNAELEAETLAAFAEEKARGTEFIAVLGYLENGTGALKNACARNGIRTAASGSPGKNRSPRLGCATVLTAPGPQQPVSSTSTAAETADFIGFELFRRPTSSSRRLKSCGSTTSRLSGVGPSDATAPGATPARLWPTSLGRKTICSLHIGRTNHLSLAGRDPIIRRRMRSLMTVLGSSWGRL
jgi:hypothetical protein